MTETELRAEIEYLRSELDKCEEQLKWCQDDYQRLGKIVRGVELRRHQDALREMREEGKL